MIVREPLVVLGFESQLHAKQVFHFCTLSGLCSVDLYFSPDPLPFIVANAIVSGSGKDCMQALAVVRISDLCCLWTTPGSAQNYYMWLCAQGIFLAGFPQRAIWEAEGQTLVRRI